MGADNPVVVRSIRDLYHHFRQSPHTTVFVSPSLNIPSDLDKAFAVIDWPLPTVEELSEVVFNVENSLPPNIPVTLNGNREAVTQALQGLTINEATCVLSNAIAGTRELGDNAIPFIVAEKKQIIRKSGTLEFYEVNPKDAQVGGLTSWKRYASIKRKTFSKKARQAGVEAAKGVILVGVPGTGKSLSAKAFAGGKMLLLRLDMGSLIGGIQGESEGNMRNALKVSEAVAPAILWLDEIEKAMSGVESSAHTDGGVFSRLFGYFLTWMQETTAPVYIMATANDLRGLKPELLRRFDDIFWCDLPNHEDRVEIFKVHLSKRGKDPETFNLDALADAAWGFTGAETEKVVKAGLEAAFFDEVEMRDTHLIQATREIVPISQTMKTQIDELRSWANGRARVAGDPFDSKPTPRNTSSPTISV